MRNAWVHTEILLGTNQSTLRSHLKHIFDYLGLFVRKKILTTWNLKQVSICSPFTERKQKITRIFFFTGENRKPRGQWLRGHSQTPSTALSPINGVDTDHSNLWLHFRNNVLGHFIDSKSGDIRVNIEVKRKHRHKTQAEFKPMSGTCVLTPRQMNCTGYVWKWNSSILFTAQDSLNAD